jgi:Zn-dependent peptidase ImmA (M78 family)
MARLNERHLLEELDTEIKHLHRDLMLTPPIDLLQICEYRGIDYGERPMPRWLDGLHSRDEFGEFICINSMPEKPIGRKRFTLAHELGHSCINNVLHITQPFCLDIEVDRPRTPMERLCNRFAADLLMPAEAVCSAVRELRTYPRAHILQSLAVLFSITPEAAAVRLRELRL